VEIEGKPDRFVLPLFRLKNIRKPEELPTIIMPDSPQAAELMAKTPDLVLAEGKGRLRLKSRGRRVMLRS